MPEQCAEEGGSAEGEGDQRIASCSHAQEHIESQSATPQQTAGSPFLYCMFPNVSLPFIYISRRVHQVADHRASVARNFSRSAARHCRRRCTMLSQRLSHTRSCGILSISGRNQGRAQAWSSKATQSLDVIVTRWKLSQYRPSVPRCTALTI